MLHGTCMYIEYKLSYLLLTQLMYHHTPLYLILSCGVKKCLLVPCDVCDSLSKPYIFITMASAYNEYFRFDNGPIWV